MSVVTLALAKQYLQIAHTAQDLVVQAMLDAAEDYIERYCGCKLANASHEEDLDGGELALHPTYLPLTAITTVTDNWDSDKAWDAAIHHTSIRVADDNYEIVDVLWPLGKARWHAKYKGGFAALPSALQLAVLQLVFRAYVQRAGESGNSAAGASFNFGDDSGIRELMRPFRQRVVDAV